MNFFKSLKFKYLRFFLIGLAIFFAAEICVIIFINNFYLKDTGKYNTSIITTTSSKNIIKPMSIDAGAEKLAVSHDGRYVAYEKNGALSVLDMSTGKADNVDSVTNAQVSCFTWIYDRDRLIIAEKTITGGGYYIKMYYYDMRDVALTEIRNNDADKDIKVNISNKTDEITGIDMSTPMVKTYVKATTQSGTSKIWEIDAFTGIDSRSYTVSKNIGKIQMLKSQDHLLYEDAANGKVYLYGDNTPLEPVQGSTSLRILGFDSSDNVYLADAKGGATRTIYCGSYDNVKDKWTWSTVKLNKAVDASEIFIWYYGGIYYNDISNSTLVKAWPISDSIQTSSASSATSSSSMTSSSKSSSSSSGSSSASTENGIKYDGKIISIFDSGFLAIYNNKITPYFFK